MEKPMKDILNFDRLIREYNHYVENVPEGTFSDFAKYLSNKIDEEEGKTQNENILKWYEENVLHNCFKEASEDGRVKRYFIINGIQNRYDASGEVYELYEDGEYLQWSIDKDALISLESSFYNPYAKNTKNCYILTPISREGFDKIVQIFNMLNNTKTLLKEY